MNTTAFDLRLPVAGACDDARRAARTTRRSIRVPGYSSSASTAERVLAFAGPGFLVAVGYMDPGNFATSLAGGSQFGYALLFVIVLANCVAMLLQAAAVRLGLGTGMDLAQACRSHLPMPLTIVLWIGCEIAIIATDLAEVLGMAIGLQLLLHVPLPLGVCLTAVDVMLVLALQKRGFRRLEAFIIGLIALIGVCFAVQLCWLRPPVLEVAHGLLPPGGFLGNARMLYVAVGIFGATVMPHNLYLHSAVVQTRAHDQSPAGLRQAVRFATLDSNWALAFALLVNAAILVVAAGAFHRTGVTVTGLSDAYRLLSPILGATGASAVFGLALLAAGLSSSVTGTLAGQVVMEGFLEQRVPLARRALLTRSLAIVPAVIVAMDFGSHGTGALLLWSQVILSVQLPFAVIPLLWFTTRRRYLGSLAFGRCAGIALWAVAFCIIGVNVWMLQHM